MAKDLLIRSSVEELSAFKVKEKDNAIQVSYENEDQWKNYLIVVLINIFKETELDNILVIDEFSATASDEKKILNEVL